MGEPLLNSKVEGSARNQIHPGFGASEPLEGFSTVVTSRPLNRGIEQNHAFHPGVVRRHEERIIGPGTVAQEKYLFRASFPEDSGDGVINVGEDRFLQTRSLMVPRAIPYPRKIESQNSVTDPGQLPGQVYAGTGWAYPVKNARIEDDDASPGRLPRGPGKKAHQALGSAKQNGLFF